MAVNVAPDRSPERLRSLSWGVVDNVLRLRAVQVDLAKSLLELRRADRFRLFETTTFPLYCERVGLSVAEGRDLCALAEASEVRAEVGVSLASGDITLRQAGMVGEVQKRPELALPGEDWLREAENRTTRDLRDLLDRRKEQVRLREDPLPLQLLVSRTGANAFRRCRELVSRKAGAIVTAGHAFEVVCEDYLERHDPERAAARLAEKDKAEAPQKGNGAARAWVDGRRRAVPEWAKREIVRRFGDRCWVKGYAAGDLVGAALGPPAN
jgi:hypothetical protein